MYECTHVHVCICVHVHTTRLSVEKVKTPFTSSFILMIIVTVTLIPNLAPPNGFTRVTVKLCEEKKYI